MHLHVSNKPLIGIVGLPRSGTTILANILNSCDNGFCVVEPVWWANCHKDVSTLSSSKIGNFPSTAIPHHLKQILEKSGFDFGGFKETYRSHESVFGETVFNDCDIVLACFREPVANFASWKKQRWGGPYDSSDKFIFNFNRFFKVCEEMIKVKPVIPIILEDLCKGKLGYFNERFAANGRIDGDLELNGLESEFGDQRALHSKTIEETNQPDILFNFERDKIHNHLDAIMQSVKNMV